MLCRSDREVILGLYQRNGMELANAPPAYQDCKAIVLSAVSENGHALLYASERLKNDYAVVGAACEQTGFAIVHASETLRNSETVALTAVKQNGSVLCSLSGTQQRNRRIVLAAFDQDPDALHFASDELLRDNEFMRAAVELNGEALLFAPPELQKDKSLALIATRTYPALFADMESYTEHHNDFDVVNAAVSQDGMLLQYVSGDLADNCFLVVRASASNGIAHVFASSRLSGNCGHGILEYINMRLTAHRGFHAFLGGTMTLKTVKKRRRTSPRRRCFLTWLDLGEATSISVKQQIAGFLGVPSAAEVVDLSQALDNICALKCCCVDDDFSGCCEWLDFGDGLGGYYDDE